MPNRKGEQLAKSLRKMVKGHTGGGFFVCLSLIDKEFDKIEKFTVLRSYDYMFFSIFKLKHFKIPLRLNVYQQNT